MVNLRYEMGFAVNGTRIPDPASFSGVESDLDTLDARDMTGELHYSKVAAKHTIKMGYNHIPRSMIMAIGALLSAEKFQFTYPSPFTGTTTTMYAHASDREFDTKWAPANGDWIGSLKFSIIEY